MNIPSASERLVLLVENDQDSCSALTMLLEAHGYKVECAATVKEAVAMLDHEPYHVILDLMLPDGSGSAVLEYVKATTPWAKVCILSGWTGPLLSEPVQPDLILKRRTDVERLMEWLREAYEPDVASGV